MFLRPFSLRISGSSFFGLAGGPLGRTHSDLAIGVLRADKSSVTVAESSVAAEVHAALSELYVSLVDRREDCPDLVHVRTQVAVQAARWATLGFDTGAFDGLGVILGDAADAVAGDGQLPSNVDQAFAALLDEVVRACAEPPAAESEPAARKPVDDDPFPAELCTEEDDELIAEFTAEASELLGAAEDGLIALDASTGDTEVLNAVFRAMHSIKGTAGFLGFVAMQKIAHAAEAILAYVREDRFPINAHADVLLAAVDCMGSMVEGIRAAGPRVAIPVPDGAEDLWKALTSAAATTNEASQTAATAKKAAAPAGASSTVRVGSGEEATVRVPSLSVDALLDAVGELLIAYSIVTEGASDAATARADLTRNLGKMGARIRSLQQISVSMRLVSLHKTFSRVQRMTRDLSRQLDKAVELHLSGADTEIDRALVETLYEPLIHMIRNALDHGLETPAERVAAGKPETGHLQLRASHVSGNVVIQFEDDGKGLNPAALKAKAVRNGLIEQGAVLTDAEAHRLIFAPGFSTAAVVTDVSGRGVGMDVVRRKMEAIHGRVEVTSRQGQGTRFTLSVPLTTAITDSMLVLVGEERFLIPTRVIRQSFQPSKDAVSHVTGKGEMVRLRDDYLPLLRLHDFLDVADAVHSPDEGLLVDVDTESGRWALLVDRIVGQRQVVVKGTGLAPGVAPCIAGGAVLGDGLVALVLDVPTLVRVARTQQEGTRTAA